MAKSHSRSRMGSASASTTAGVKAARSGFRMTHALAPNDSASASSAAYTAGCPSQGAIALAAAEISRATKRTSPDSPSVSSASLIPGTRGKTTAMERLLPVHGAPAVRPCAASTKPGMPTTNSAGGAGRLTSPVSCSTSTFAIGLVPSNAPSSNQSSAQRQCKNARQWNAYPGRPVIQLIHQLVKGLVEHIDLQQPFKCLRRHWHHQVTRGSHGKPVRMQKGAGHRLLPQPRPGFQPVGIAWPARQYAHQPGVGRIAEGAQHARYILHG